jgi:hypothetical protein
VLTHTNLKLEQRLELYEDSLLPWDIEMTVGESVSGIFFLRKRTVHHGITDLHKYTEEFFLSVYSPSKETEDKTMRDVIQILFHGSKQLSTRT